MKEHATDPEKEAAEVANRYGIVDLLNQKIKCTIGLAMMDALPLKLP